MKQERVTGIFDRFEESSKPSDLETLRVNRGRRAVTGQFNAQFFTDKDTHQIVYYMPTLDVSGYGETKEKAVALLQESAQNLFQYWLTLTPKQLKKELQQLGWKQVPLSTKDYSKTSVDSIGELQNYNAVDNRVERLTLKAA